MIILGIDPGTTSIGYALVRGGAKPAFIRAGLIPIHTKENSARLLELHHGIQHLIAAEKPDAVAIERLFFATNAKTAFLVSEARGVILLTTALAKLNAYEYTPLEVKKTITGDGKADKSQIKKMVRLTLAETKTLEARDDVYDAIAVALTCCYHERLLLQKNN